ncbi:hypothetical protein P389DRAFT_70989 [Cystobasidium minutum MCA 4210]|uniref:uncharacterized protein n=1 Tax=Cystobasidium minutum MCA 4210 TaxID=1397322 RepID=UPI0034CFED2B|eukprot:jgi/Rhomi1/70989/CE70988_5118
MSSKIQTSDEIVKIVGASPFFLARVARARRLADLHIVANIHHQDGSSDLVTSMTSQPEYISEDVADEYSYPGLPYLLDIVFDEQVSGIRTDPARPRPAKITREDWALQAVRRMFKDSKDVPKASKLNAVAFQLLAYSVERHDQEVNLEMQATRHCLAMLQKHFSNQKPDHNLPAAFRTRAVYFYRIWHQQAFRLLLANEDEGDVEYSRMMTIMSQASAAAAILAYQIAGLEIVLRLHTKNVDQLAAIFNTGITASSTAGAAAPHVQIPPDVPLEPGFQYQPYAFLAGSSEPPFLVTDIANDMQRQNRLTPQARDLVLAHVQARMSSLASNSTTRSLLLSVLSFYPEDVGLHITLSCCYSAVGQHGAQAYLCQLANELAQRNGSVCSEALTNLAVARIAMNEFIQALSDLDKACKVKPANWDALYSTGYLLTNLPGNEHPPRKQAMYTRQYFSKVLQLLRGTSSPLEDGHYTVQPANSEQIPLRDICKLQGVMLTMGALAMQSGQPEVALADYVHGIEMVLCRQSMSAESGDEGAHTKEGLLTYTLSDLVKAINFHVQYLWLEKSAGQKHALTCHRNLLAATSGLVDRNAMQKNCMEHLRQYPRILESGAVPFPNRPVLLLLLPHIEGLAQLVLNAGQTNGLVIAPIASAENVDLEWRKLADTDAVSVLADLVLAVCQILDCHLRAPSSSVGDALLAHLGIRPSWSCLMDLYYFSISLKPQAQALHNLAILCAMLDPSYPPTRLFDADSRVTFLTPADFAYFWMEKASRAQPPGVVSTDALQAIQGLRESQRAENAHTLLPPESVMPPVEAAPVLPPATKPNG